MADLKPLIRLRKYRVEEKQKILADLFREAEALEGKKTALLRQKDEEQAIAEASENFDAIASFTLFAERVRMQIELIDEAIAKLDQRIVIAQEAMREAFGELKKVEIIQRNRELEEDKKEARRESTTLDEVGLTGFVRRTEEDQG